VSRSWIARLRCLAAAERSARAAVRSSATFVILQQLGGVALAGVRPGVGERGRRLLDQDAEQEMLVLGGLVVRADDEVPDRAVGADQREGPRRARHIDGAAAHPERGVPLDVSGFRPSVC
jgi:hypothetical protein